MNEVNIVGVLVALVAAMVIGGVWYSPFAFGKTWMSLAGVDAEQSKKAAPQAMIVMLVTTFIKAYALAQVSYFAHKAYHHSFFHDAFATSVVVWLGFVLTQIATRNVFEQKKFTLTLIGAGCELVIFVVMGLIIGAIGLP